MKESARYKIFVLVGPPSVGKSTWISEHFASRDKKSYFVVSRDDIVEQVAHKFGMAYDDMYTQPPQKSKIGDEDQTLGRVISQPNKPGKMAWDRVYEANQEINQRFEQRMRQASGFNGDIVIDMTNMEPYPRKRALQIISRRHDEFEKIAVVFKFQGFEEQLKANALRRAEEEAKQGKYKTVTPDIMERMFKSYKPVTPDEGFDRIVDVDNTASIQKLIDKKPEPAMDVKTESKIRRMVKEALLKEYFMTKTKTRSDLKKKLPKPRVEYQALGRDVDSVIRVLQECDQAIKRKIKFVNQRNEKSAVLIATKVSVIYNIAFNALSLKELGEGTTRKVFAINDDLVLKYQMGPRDNQNIKEIKIIKSGLLEDFVPKIYAVSDYNSRWMICDRVKTLSNKSEMREWLEKTNLLELFNKIPNNNNIGFIREKEEENFANVTYYTLKFFNEIINHRTISKDPNAKRLFEIFDKNKLLHVLIRAHREIGMSIDDFNEKNVGFTILDRKPVLLDVGYEK
jgi:predicted kinase